MGNKLFKKIKRIHFIGVGGVGVSAIARMVRLQRIKVTGSDIVNSPIVERVRNIGGKVVIGHKKSNLPQNIDIVVYSPAIREDNPELILAKKLKIPIYSYPEILGLISQDMYTIAVSGTHGKTTTTSMIAEIMIYANQAPTVVIGGFLKRQKDNFVLGTSRYFLVEACEYKESFLSLFPNILVITNIDNDHLDYYKNIKNIQKAFTKLIFKTDSFIVCNLSDKNTQEIIKNLKKTEKLAKIVDYSKEKLVFDLLVPGRYNIQNAKIALAVARLIGIKKEKAETILKKYPGTWRRFEYKGKTVNGSLIYDDYAHHPTEVKAVIAAAREKFPNKRIIAVFQPHLYSRTKFFLKDFAKSFDEADRVVITDIYAAREKENKTIHSKDLVREINKNKKKSIYVKKFPDIIKHFKKERNNSIIITIGAGDIYKIGEKLRKIC